MAEMAQDTDDRIVEFKTDGSITIGVVGRAPTDLPYLRLGDAEDGGHYLGSLDLDDMVALRDAITRAVKHRAC